MVRHGETESNRTHIIQVHLDAPLSDIGLEQAQLVAKHLSSTIFTLAISSDLIRALKTGQSIRENNTSFKYLFLFFLFSTFSPFLFFLCFFIFRFSSVLVFFFDKPLCGMSSSVLTVQVTWYESYWKMMQVPVQNSSQHSSHT